MAEQAANIEALLEEDRTFPPSPEFVRQANINDPNIYDEAERDFQGFWGPLCRRADLVPQVGLRIGVGPAPRQVVRGRQDQRLL